MYNTNFKWLSVVSMRMNDFTQNNGQLVVVQGANTYNFSFDYAPISFADILS